ncbi:hypothetical protein [Paraburkholderia sp. ZP32-5]|uniref:hypothetical protein n=1 Tax=Paraburkholderia sp. ZP32-5 TaxID=2883245 RepID=UPI001F43079C|nr:hypothetical protein [Paraburkholderia sp. ZP32-5]
MSDRRPPYLPFDDDDDDEQLREQTRLHDHEFAHASSRSFGHGLPPYRPDTGEVIHGCPACESFRTQPRHIARRIGGAIGATAGGTSAAAAALSGAELGAVAGTLGGPFGVLCGGIAGAIIAGLAGAAAGCATGAALGENLDQKVLRNWYCSACGHAFSIRPD